MWPDVAYLPPFSSAYSRTTDCVIHETQPILPLLHHYFIQTRESEAAFNRAFRRLVGSPPATWRQVKTSSNGGSAVSFQR
jgi:hypothetical protein